MHRYRLNPQTSCGVSPGGRLAAPRACLAGLVIALTLVVSLFMATSGAEAVVVNMNGGNLYGVAVVPDTAATVSSLPTVHPSGCTDPWLSSDLGGPSLPAGGLCWQGGGASPSNAVIHANETFAISWDQHRLYWGTTKQFLQQFLSDVSAASGSLGSVYSVTTQYRDAGGRAANSSTYGGGCTDFGITGRTGCTFGSGTVPGHDYYGNNGPGTSGPQCVPSGSNTYCLTDAQIRAEVTNLIASTGLGGHVQPNHTPLLVMLMPTGVETCIDGAGTVCSANASPSTAQFCSYHSFVTVGGTDYSYVVQPWTANTPCDEPNLPVLPNPATAQEVAVDAGTRIASPLSAGMMAAIVNPWLNGWFASTGGEISDNGGCGPGGNPGPPGYPYDAVNLGSDTYYLQREFSNAGVLESDPNAPACALGVALSANFVAPSAVNQGDEVQLDGSTTVSSLIVPNANYQWDFGDGTTATGASVVHAYATSGTYTATLTVTDRGGNQSTISQRIVVLGPNGQPAQPGGQPGQPGSPPGKSPSPGLVVHLQLMPQSLRAVLRAGLAVRVTSNVRVDGIVTLSISRAEARRAHIKAGPGPAVAVGRGTVSRIKSGTVTLHLRLSRTIAAKLRRLKHVTLTARFALFAAGGRHIAVDVAGHY